MAVGLAGAAAAATAGAAGGGNTKGPGSAQGGVAVAGLAVLPKLAAVFWKCAADLSIETQSLYPSTLPLHAVLAAASAALALPASSNGAGAGSFAETTDAPKTRIADDTKDMVLFMVKAFNPDDSNSRAKS